MMQRPGIRISIKIHISLIIKWETRVEDGGQSSSECKFEGYYKKET